MDPKLFIEVLKSKGITHYFGVPDSLLKPLLSNIYQDPELSYVITANEGNAVAMAAGYHLATGKIAAVFLQNSGIGNMINPILSLISPAVYNIPVTFIVGYRGEPGGPHDEPQHVDQGRVTCEQLSCVGLQVQEITKEMTDDLCTVRIQKMINDYKHPAFLISKGAFGEESRPISKGYYVPDLAVCREDAIRRILQCHPHAKIFATTGMIGREVYEVRNQESQSHANDFLSVGSMGHISSIAVGYAMEHPDQEVVILDGDGSFIMHMGSALQVSKAMREGCKIFHYILDNNCHASVGGGATLSDQIDFEMIAKALKYPAFIPVRVSLNHLVPTYPGSAMIHVIVGSSSRKDLGRPKESPIVNKNLFMSHVND